MPASSSEKASRKAKITLQLVKSLTAPVKWPASGNVVTWDEEVTGFGVRVTAAGSIAYVLRYVAGGREHRITIGKHPDLTASAAREKAIRMRGTIVDGANPLRVRTDARRAPTVSALCDDYLARYAEPKKRSKSVANDRWMIERYIRPHFGSMKVATAGERDVDDLHRSLKEKPYLANRVLALLSKMFSLAVGWKWRPDNPAKGIERFQEHRRDRWLNTDEITRLALALDSYQSRRTANAIRLLLFTGARRNEVLAASWEQFDFDRGVWTKPSHHTKQKKTEHVPLSAPALSVLSRMKAEADELAAALSRNRKGDEAGGAFLFPGNKDGAPLTDIKKAWLAICRAAGMAYSAPKLDVKGKPVMKRNGEPVLVWKATARIHDLRHTFASHLVSSGLSLPLVGRLLGHTQAATTQRYAHLADDPMREAADRFGTLVKSLTEGRPQVGKVVPMKLKSAARQ